MAKSNSELMAKMEAKAESEKDKPKSLLTQVCDFLAREDIQGHMAKYGSKQLEPGRLTRVVMTCIRTNPDLAKCSLESLLACLMLAQQYELEPGTGQCWLIPRGGQCTFMIGYQGYLEIISRAYPGCLIEAQPLYSNDKFVARRGYKGDASLSTFLHEEAFPDRGELVGFYCYFRPLNGQAKYERMTLAEVKTIADAHGNRAIWSKHFVERGRATAVRRLQKYIPKTTQIFEAAQSLGLDLEQEAETVSMNLGEQNRPVAALDAPQTAYDITFTENEAQPTLGLSDSQSDMAFEIEQ